MRKRLTLLFLLMVFYQLGSPGQVSAFAVSQQLKEQTYDYMESRLLLSEADGMLSQNEAREIIKELESPIVRSHVVGRNEWLEKIAQEYGVPAISIRSTNNLEDTYLRPGQQILVQNKKGMFHLAKQGESVETVIKYYEKLGGKRDKILAANSWDSLVFFRNGEVFLQEGSVLWIPDAVRSFPFMRPVAWQRISSRYGFRKHPLLKVKRFHDGFDMVAPYGAPVYAGDKGTVIFAGWMGGYGNTVEIQHEKIITRYGHLSKIYVQVGQAVKRKKMIGRVGSTGLSTGPHLHFEVRRRADGKPINPRKYLF